VTTLAVLSAAGAADEHPASRPKHSAAVKNRHRTRKRFFILAAPFPPDGAAGILFLSLLLYHTIPVKNRKHPENLPYAQKRKPPRSCGSFPFVDVV
jgi:hypothetical protein